MVLGIVVFGAVFLVGLATRNGDRETPRDRLPRGRRVRRGARRLQTHEPLAGFAVFALIALVGLVVDSVRETSRTAAQPLEFATPSRVWRNW